MNVVPKGAPASAPSPANDSRAKAIAAFNSQPVPNATSISPEEMGAIHAQPGVSDKVETQASAEVPAEPEKAKEDPLSSQYATLARKEKALRAQIQQFKAEQEKFKAERDTLSKPAEIDYSKYIERDRLKADPLSAFEEAGLSYDELTEQVLARQSMQTDPRIIRQMEQMQAEIKAAREEAKALRDSQEGAQKTAYEQAVANIRSEAGKLVLTDPSFEMVKATNSVSDVVELIEQTYKEEGNLLSVEEACQMVEDHLLEEAMKLTKIKKLQQKLGQSTANPPVNNSKQQQSNAPKTLTNGMTGQKPMSAKERAIAAFEGKLKA